MPLPLAVSCFSKIETGFTFLVPAGPGSPGQWAVKRCVCVCVCVCALIGQLASGCRLQGGPVRRYKDSLKINLRACDLAPSVLRTGPLDRSVWRQCCSNAISAFEERRTAALVAKQKARLLLLLLLPCCCKRDDDVDLRRLRQTMRLAHWSVCPSQVAPMTWGSVDLDDSVHRVCVCVCVCARQTGLSHACGCGFMPILQLLDSVDDVDPNLADNDGNTPLIFAAQAGIRR